MRTRQKGFTLIELLIVIAIIAILAGLLFPVFSRAREQGRKNACLSNVKQLGIAFAMYAQDWDGRFPPYAYDTPQGSYFWCVYYDKNSALWDVSRGLIYPYLANREIFRCPDWETVTSAYGYNWYYIGTPDAPAKESDISRPSETVLLADAADKTTLGPAELMWAISPPSIYSLHPHYLHFRHNGTANAVFADGHAKSLSPLLRDLDYPELGSPSGDDSLYDRR